MPCFEEMHTNFLNYLSSFFFFSDGRDDERRSTCLPVISRLHMWQNYMNLYSIFHQIKQFLQKPFFITPVALVPVCRAVSYCDSIDHITGFLEMFIKNWRAKAFLWCGIMQLQVENCLLHRLVLNNIHMSVLAFRVSQRFSQICMKFSPEYYIRKLVLYIS